VRGRLVSERRIPLETQRRRREAGPMSRSDHNSADPETRSCEALLVATHNAHKTGEFRAMLGDLFAEVTDLASIPGMVPPEETGETFEANAVIKALAASRERPDVWILADDSGLVVDALDGAPGVRSARYAGPDADDAANRRRLLEALAAPHLDGRPRTARFRCVLALAKGGEVLATFAGAVEGRLVEKDRGEGGFGYDPLFVPEGHDATFGELPESVKNALSHRARAIEAFRRWWQGRKLPTAPR